MRSRMTPTFLFSLLAVAVSLVAIVLALTSCAPETGNVYGKHYYASYVYATNNCIQYSKAGVCLINIPTFHTQPERYQLCLDDGKDRGCRDVDERTYHEYKIGDFYGG